MSLKWPRAGRKLVEDKTNGPAVISALRHDVSGLIAITPEGGKVQGRLKVTPQGAEILARSSAGIFYGVQTLLQMVEGTGSHAVLPAVEVRDWPSLAHRGFMMDLSHGQRLRVEEIERQIDFLARFKANQYYFYSEAGIELEWYSLVNPDNRYTREELRRIIGYAHHPR